MPHVRACGLVSGIPGEAYPIGSVGGVGGGVASEGEFGSVIKVSYPVCHQTAMAIFKNLVSYFSFSNSNASCTSCSALGPSALLMMHEILISLVVMFCILI